MSWFPVGKLKNVARTQASASDITSCFQNEKDALFRLRFLITGDEAQAEASVINAVARVFMRGHSLANAVSEPLGAFEWVALSYLGFSGTLMVIFHNNLERPALHIAEHLGVAVAILFITNIAYRTSRRESLWPRIAMSLSWVRDWYPQAVFFSVSKNYEFLFSWLSQRGGIPS